MASLFHVSDPTQRSSKHKLDALDREKAECRMRYTPRPLPSKRQRRLSLPSSQASFDRPNSGQKIADQTQSALLSRFPLEIRSLIYQHVLGGNLMHVTTIYGCLHGRMAHINCLVPFAPSGDHKNCWRRKAEKASPALSPGKSDDRGLLSILRTCRQM